MLTTVQGTTKLGRFHPLATSIVATVVLFSYMAIAPDNRIMVYEDDALFYGIIANNHAAHKGYSFDGGFSTTNGFHWGKMLLTDAVVSVAFRFVETPSLKDVFSILYFADVMSLVFFSVLGVTCMRRWITSTWIAGFLTFLLAQSFALAFGMEGGGAALSILALVSVISKTLWRTRLWLISLLSILIVLFRIDLFWVPIILCVIARHLKRYDSDLRIGLKEVTFSLLGTSVGIILVLMLNVFSAGDPMSSSIIAKSLGAQIRIRDLLTNLASNMFSLAVFVGTGAATIKMIVDRHGSSRTFVAAMLAMTGLLALLQVVVQRSLGGNNVGLWYDCPWMVLLASSSLAVVEDLRKRLGLLGQGLAIAICVALVLLPLAHRDIRIRATGPDSTTTSYYRSLSEFGAKIEENSRPDDLIGVSDLPGRFAYYSNRRIVALDGLANNPEYVRDFLQTRCVSEYARKYLTFVVDIAQPTSDLNAARQVILLGFPFNQNIKCDSLIIAKEQIVATVPVNNSAVARLIRMSANDRLPP